MDSRRYVDIPGSSAHELPPLLVRGTPESMQPREEIVAFAEEIVESEDMLTEVTATAGDVDQRKLDLALHLTDQYFGLMAHWQWGDSIVEWIRQCEMTFEMSATLRHLLHTDVWPHAGRSSFVDLLLEKNIATHGVALEKAVGLRLTFRQPPPIECFSNQFLFYLNASVAGTAYQTWAHMSAELPAHLPPERFFFQVHELETV